MTSTTYEIRVTVIDTHPGRARAKARAEMLATILGHDNGATLAERLHALGYSLEHAPEVAQVIE